METLDDIVRGAFRDMPGGLPSPEQSERQRILLMSHIAEAAPQHRSRRRPTTFKMRVPLGIALGLALSGLGGGIGWAISSSSPSASPPAGSPNVYTTCAGSTSTGLTANYIVAGSECGPGHLPQVGFNAESPPHTYCAVSGEASIPQNMIFVIDSTACPSGYETTSAPPDSTTPTT